MNKEDETIAVGKITGAHGIRGEVKLSPYASLEGAHWKTVYVRSGKTLRAMEVTRVRTHKGGLILELEGLEDRSSAEALAGTELCLRKEDLPGLSEDEYYYSDLLGAAVVTDEGRELGRVEEIIATGSNDVLEVKGPSGTVLIPAIEGVVLEVDTDNSRIVVRLLEGLLPEEQAEEQGE